MHKAMREAAICRRDPIGSSLRLGPNWP